MTIEERIKELISSRYGTMREFSKQIEMSQSTLATIMNRGIHKASIGNVLKICQALQISADELANDKIVPANSKVIHRFVVAEIPEMISYIRKNINDYADMTINGKELSHEEWYVLLDGVDLTIDLIKRKRERINK